MFASDRGGDSNSMTLLDGKRGVPPRDPSEEGLVDAASECIGAAFDITEVLLVGASTLFEGGACCDGVAWVMLLSGRPRRPCSISLRSWSGFCLLRVDGAPPEWPS